MILIPIKNLATAKQRLAAVLDQPSRTQLAQAMLQDVAAALASWRERPPCSFVTSDPFALEVAKQHDFQIIPDSQNAGETAAIEAATELCVQRGIRQLLVVPADIPLIRASEFKEIFAQAPEEGSLLVPAADGRGTNAALRSPANLFPLRFGNDSFKPHRAAAQATGKPCIVLTFTGVALDVDHPTDLADLLAADGDTRSQILLRRWVAEDKLMLAQRELA